MKTAIPSVIAALYLAWVFTLGNKWYDAIGLVILIGLLPMALGAWLNEVFKEEE